jgi:hypothetical protein
MEMELHLRNGPEGNDRRFILSTVINNRHGRIGLGEIDSNLLLLLKKELKPIDLILFSVSIIDLVDLAGIIRKLLKGSFHPLGNGKDAIPLGTFGWKPGG